MDRHLGAVYTGTKRVVSATFLFRIARSSHEAVPEPRKRTPKMITGPKVDRSADGTLWGAEVRHLQARHMYYSVSSGSCGLV